MSLNHSNSPMDADPKDLDEAEPSETTEEATDAPDRPFGHMTDKPGGEGGTPG
jgi:hypothetical protein